MTLQTKFRVELNMGDLTCILRQFVPLSTSSTTPMVHSYFIARHLPMLVFHHDYACVNICNMLSRSKRLHLNDKVQMYHNLNHFCPDVRPLCQRVGALRYAGVQSVNNGLKKHPKHVLVTYIAKITKQ